MGEPSDPARGSAASWCALCLGRFEMRRNENTAKSCAQGADPQAGLMGTLKRKTLGNFLRVPPTPHSSTSPERGIRTPLGHHSFRSHVDCSNAESCNLSLLAGVAVQCSRHPACRASAVLVPCRPLTCVFSSTHAVQHAPAGPTSSPMLRAILLRCRRASTPSFRVAQHAAWVQSSISILPAGSLLIYRQCAAPDAAVDTYIVTSVLTPAATCAG